MFKITILILALSFVCIAKDTVVKFKGIAKANGAIAYTEQHELIYRDDKLISSRTFYFDSNNQHFATENNKFTTEDYAFPESKIYYPKDDSVYEGSRIQKGKYVIYRKEKNGLHEEEYYDADEFSIAGQGIHFYLLHHLEKVKKSKELEFRFLIPARLDHYTFEYKFEKEENGKYYFKVEVASWLFKLLAPSFEAVYDIKKKRIVFYKGLSSWKNSKGELQNVEITYEY